MTRLARATRAAVAAGLLASACSGVGHDDRREAERRQAGETRDLFVGSIELSQLLAALQDERNASTLRIIGMEDVVSLDLVGLDEARPATDELVPTAPIDLAAPLATLRGDVDERIATGSATVAEQPAAWDTMAAYDEVVHQLVDRTEALALEGLDDPGARDGVQALYGALRMEQLADGVVPYASFATFGPGSESTIAALAAAWSDLEAAVEEVRAVDDPTYAGVVDAEFPADAYEVFGDVVTGILAGEITDVGTTIDVGDDLARGFRDLWMALLDASAEEDFQDPAG